MCDDDNISPVTTEDILKLSGGGMYPITLINKSLKSLFLLLCLLLVGPVFHTNPIFLMILTDAVGLC